MKYESRAALLRAAADSIEMQEKAGIEPVCKHNGSVVSIGGLTDEDGWSYCPFTVRSNYEFPLAVVEGKPVFVGDVLYEQNGSAITFGPAADKSYINSFCGLSWTKPKPRTVMVEMDIEEAEYLASFKNEDVIGKVRSIAIRAYKALEAL